MEDIVLKTDYMKDKFVEQCILLKKRLLDDDNQLLDINKRMKEATEEMRKLVESENWDTKKVIEFTSISDRMSGITKHSYKLRRNNYVKDTCDSSSDDDNDNDDDDDDDENNDSGEK